MIDPLPVPERSSSVFAVIPGCARARRRRRTGLAALAIALAAAVAAPPAGAIEVGGFRFDDTIRIGGTDLRLNGVGLRSVFILKAFLAALYVPQRTADPVELIHQSGPRRLQLRMLVDMSPDRLLKTFTAGLHDGPAEPHDPALKARIDELDTALKAVGTVRKGETLDLDVVDGQMRLLVNGQMRAAVPGEDVFAAILRGWIGERPLEKDLKKGLLGG
ncbi:MAG: chalcone isomerase family protein [Burkholderiaceae bacterium]